MHQATCLYCDKPLKGRADKKFCDSGCRSNYNNQKNFLANSFMRNVNKKLRKNRKILSDYLPQDSDSKKVRKEYLLLQGFNFDYFTNIYTTKQDKSYHFVYDYGYLQLNDEWFLVVRRNQGDT